MALKKPIKTFKTALLKPIKPLNWGQVDPDFCPSLEKQNSSTLVMFFYEIKIKKLILDNKSLFEHSIIDL